MAPVGATIFGSVELEFVDSDVFILADGRRIAQRAGNGWRPLQPNVMIDWDRAIRTSNC
jgi:hypothetical protein